MYKLVLLAALVAVAMAKPGLVHSPIAVADTGVYDTYYRAPIVKTVPYGYAAAPVYTPHVHAASYAYAPTVYNSAPYPFVATLWNH